MKIFKMLYTALISVLVLFFANHLKADEDVRHKEADISSDIQYHSYIQKLPDSKEREIKYFMLKAPNGDIKTAFDACDVCYKQLKGYSQIGEQVMCNNCGNQYAINAIGNEGQGGCWPGYLPHRIENGELIINIVDLVAGEYFFPSRDATGIVEDLPNDYKFVINNNLIEFISPEIDNRIFHIFGIDGGLIKSFSSNSAEVTFDVSGYLSGKYIMVVEEGEKIYKKSFVVIK